MSEEYEWTVLGESDNMVQLVSKNSVNGLLPKGSFLTVESKGEDRKFILRADKSTQSEPYSPNPLISDLDVEPINQDRKCKNIVEAFRVKDIPESDGLVPHIRPYDTARRSTQEEVSEAFDIPVSERGPPIFLASVYANENQKLRGRDDEPLRAYIPDEAYFYQTLVAGKTGAGKTVATKYLAQKFMKEKGGAVLALNVKEQDFLHMDKPSETESEEVKSEWESLNFEPKGIRNFRIYRPNNADPVVGERVDKELVEKITLTVNSDGENEDIKPEAISGLLQGISEQGSQELPGIFRYWKEEKANSSDGFKDFLDYFNRHSEDREFYRYDVRGRRTQTSMHPSTYKNVRRELNQAMEFFDAKGARTLTAEDILSSHTMSVIDVTGDKGIRFGSIMLRDLLRRIKEKKRKTDTDVPILIIIDEVHEFYDNTSSEDALEDLSEICRTGRSQEIGIMFSSQDPKDIPKGLTKVINTKIFFKSDSSEARKHGIDISSEEMETLESGYAAASIHGVPQLKFIKFPLSQAGVLDG